MPMFYVHETSDLNEARYEAQRITDQAVIDERRLKQRSFLPIGEKPLTAELCARRLQKAIRHADSPHYILIPFGEIISYCFLHQVIYNIACSGEDQNPDWDSIGVTAWNTICAEYSKSQRRSVAETNDDILNNVKAWYELSAKTFDERKKLNGTIHSEIYILSAEISALLKAANYEPLSKSSTLSCFLARWAAFICGNIDTNERNEELMDEFWNCTFINPKIEQFLGSRGLYVTVVHSQVSKEPSGIPALYREVYAICTLFNASRLEQGNNQSYLDNILRRLAQTQLAQFEYEELERHYEKLSGTLNLLNSIANPGHDWQRLTEEAVTLCGYLSSAKVVLLAWPDFGVCAKVFDEKHNGFQWYRYLSRANQTAKNIARLIRRSQNEQLTLEQHTETTKERDQHRHTIVSEVVMPLCANCDTLEFTFGGADRGLLIVWFEKSLAKASVSEELQRALLALSIGLEMPYRSAIGRGALSWLLSFFFDPRTTIKELVSRFRGCPQRCTEDHRSPIHNMLTGLLATIAEISQLGYVSIAFIFLASVYRVLFKTIVEAYSGTGEEGKSSIVSTLNTVEHTVMAFSICLASTGVIFLLKPDMAANLPSWMRSFGKLGTLEKTLVRLAAMVLTIDVLAATLSLRIKLEASKGLNFWGIAGPVLFYVMIYLVVLTGLAFLSRYLLKEEPDSDSDAGDNKKWNDK